MTTEHFLYDTDMPTRTRIEEMLERDRAAELLDLQKNSDKLFADYWAWLAVESDLSDKKARAELKRLSELKPEEWVLSTPYAQMLQSAVYNFIGPLSVVDTGEVFSNRSTYTNKEVYDVVDAGGALVATIYDYDLAQLFIKSLAHQAAIRTIDKTLTSIRRDMPK